MGSPQRGARLVGKLALPATAPNSRAEVAEFTIHTPHAVTPYRSTSRCAMALRAVVASEEEKSSLPRSSISCVSEAGLNSCFGDAGLLLWRLGLGTATSLSKEFNL